MRRLKNRGIVALEDDAIVSGETNPETVPTEVVETPVVNPEVPAEPVPAEVSPEDTGTAIAATEDEVLIDGEPVVIQLDDVIIEEDESGDSLETRISEVSESAEEFVKNDEETGEIIEVANALESIADVLRISSANGGMDKISATGVSIAVQHLYDRVKLNKVAMPALESFGGTDSRITATYLAMESIVDHVKKIWKIIIEQIKKGIAIIGEFFDKIFSAWSKLKDRSTSVLLNARKNRTNSPRSKLLSAYGDEKILRYLQINNGIPTDMVAAANIYLAQMTLVFTDNSNRISKKDIAYMFEKHGVEKNFIEQFKITPELGTLDLCNDVITHKGGIVTKHSKKMFGNKVITTNTTDNAVSGSEAISLITYINISLDHYGTDVSTMPIKVLSLNEINSLAKITYTFSKRGEEYRSSVNEINNIKKELLSIADKANIQCAKTLDADEYKNYAAMSKVISHFAKLTGKIEAECSQYALTTCKVLLDYCEASLKQYA